MSNLKKHTHFEYILSFLLPPLFMLIAFAVSGIFPFGAKSILASDLQEQYIHIIAETANKIKSGESLYLSHKAGFGTNFFVQAKPYLTPQYLPFLFFDTRDYQEVFTVVYLFDLSLSGLAASIFFRHSSAAFLSGRINAAFSVLYALIMFNVTNRINIFFTNDVIMLPLCFLGVEQLILKKRLAPFAAAYGICVFGGYYNMPFITGTACFIYFVYFAVISLKSFGEAVKPFLLLMLSAVVSGGLCTFMLLPAINAVSTSYGSVFSSGNSLIAYNIPYVCRNFLFINDGAPVYADTPAVFLGIMPVFMTLWFVFCSNARKKEKCAVLCIFVFYFLSFYFAPLYAAMHFFRLPMGYDGRYTYAIALIFLVFSARASRINQKANAKLPLPLIIIICGILLALKPKINLYYIVFALGVFALALFYTLIQKSNKRAALLSAAAVAEALICAVVGTNIITKYIVHPDHNGFKTYLDYTKKAADEIKSGDPYFYRAVDLYSPCKLFQLCAGYNSISTFLSTANQNASNYAKLLGVNVPDDGRSVSNSGNCAVTDSIFCIKYLFAPDKRAVSADTAGRTLYAPDGMRLTNSIYNELDISDTAAVYENTAVFPLMFAAERDVADCGSKFSEDFGAYVKNQEIFLNAVLGTDKTFYKKCSVSETEKQHYTFTVSEDGDYAAEFSVKNPPASVSWQSYAIIVNGCYLNLDYRQDNILRDLGNFKKGDIIDIQIPTANEDITVQKPLLFKFDSEAFKSAAKQIQNNGLTDITENNGVITAKSNFDNKRFVFSSISYDKGFKLYIDGVSSEIVPVSNAFIGFEVPEGSHTIRLEYKTPGLEKGIYISLSFTLFILISLFIKKKQA